jgi:hypothetical protein
VIIDGGRFDTSLLLYTGAELVAFETIAHGTGARGLRLVNLRPLA